MKMETKKRGDLAINGFGASNGGQFHRVTINGKGTINNDVECSEFECNGSGTVQANVRANTAKISGMAKIDGNIESQLLTIDGTAKIGQNLNVKKLKVNGKATIGGRVKAEEISIKGRLTVEEDCEAEIFKAESQFKIGGLLNAEQVDIQIFGDCKAKEIGGQTIIIRHKTALFGLFKPFFQTKLETELIEGDKIEIENTNAKIVRGNHVTIGPNSTIGLVEYTTELSIDEKAIVGESRKI
jgi:cytoskeletal protein CcmA (bactofilin family)